MKPHLSLLLSFCLAPCVAQTLGGPSLLSRGRAPELRPAGASEFQPFAGTTSGYDTGLPNQDLDHSSGPFQEIDGGLDARRITRHASLRLDYRFNLRHYTEASRLD